MKEKSRDIFMYFGRNLDHGYPAWRLNNTIAVLEKNFVSQFENHLLLKLISETHPNEIDIHYFSRSDKSIWDSINSLKEDHGKNVPQFASVTIGSADDLAVNIEGLKHIVESRLEDSKSGCKKTIGFIRTQQMHLNDKLREAIRYITTYGRQVDVYLVLVIEGEGEHILDIIDCFGIRICGSILNENISNNMIGCNLATKLQDAASAVLWSSSASSELVRLFLPYLPDTYISKFIRIYGMRQN